jgi:hypothetical protein
MAFLLVKLPGASREQLIEHDAQHPPPDSDVAADAETFLIRAQTRSFNRRGARHTLTSATFL